MRRKMSLLVLLGLFAGCALCGGALFATDRTARIDAVRGKEYKLTKAHGPWMILAATFREPPPEARTKGMTPEEAANELVYELRCKGIPAYKLSQDEVVDTVQTMDRTGRMRVQKIKAQQSSISVLAGNYPDNDPETKDGQRAQTTLAIVKKFQPQFLQGEEKNNGILHKLRNGGVSFTTPGRPKPLSGAFLTINPLLSPEEARQKKSNPLLAKLNSGNEYSLLENHGKYTLVVASFEGKSAMQVPNTHLQNADKKFEVSSSNLDNAAYMAWELAKSLRRHEKKFEAYVWHDKFSSVVTVGSFNSPDDSRLVELRKLFGAKVKKDPRTGQDVLLAEMLTIPYKVPPGKEPDKRWMFDPVPRVIEVPKL